MQEVPPDAAVETDALGHVLNVGAQPLAQVGNLVDEGDLGRQEAVGGVLDELSRLERGEEHRRLGEEQRPVERPHDRLRPFGLDTDDDPVGAHEIADRGALSQELRIRDRIERSVRPSLPNDARDLAPGADGHRRFRRDDGVAVEGVRDLAGRLMDMGKVGVTIAAPARRTDGQHHHIGLRYGGGQVLGKGEASRGNICREQRLQPRLVDRYPPGAERRNPLRIGIDAGHG